MADIPLKLYKKENYVQVAPGFNTPAGSTPITNYSEVLETAKQRYNELSNMGTLTDTSLLGRLNTGTATAEDVHKIYTTGGASMSSQESQQLLSALQSLQSNNVMPSSGYSDVGGVMTSNASIAEKQAHEAALAAGTEVNIGTAEAPLYVPTESPAAINPLGVNNVSGQPVAGQTTQPTTTPTTTTTPMGKILSVEEFEKIVGRKADAEEAAAVQRGVMTKEFLASRGYTIPTTPTTTPTATRQEVVGFPKSSDEYDQWIAQGRKFENGKWYEGSTAAISPTDRIAGQTLAGNPQAQAVLDELRSRIDGLTGEKRQELINSLPTAVKIALVEPAVDEFRKRYDAATEEEKKSMAKDLPRNIKELMLGPALTEFQERIDAGNTEGLTMTEEIKDLLIKHGDNTTGITTKVTQDTDGTRDKEKTAEEEAAKAENDKAVASAQEIVNQQADLAKLQTQAEIDKYREQLGMIKKPAEVNFTSTYETLRNQYGVSGIEQSVNSLNSQITALQDSLTAGLYDEEGKLRPMELISARQQEMTRQVQEKLATLNRSKENLQAELNTKNTLISNIMSLKQTDYSNAQQEYEKEYSKQMDMINLTRDVEEEAEDDAKALTDAAQANLNTVVNMTEGKSWDELDATLKGKIAELELKAGLPSGITQTFLNEKPDAEILTTTTGFDANGQQVVSFVYKNPDGTVGTIKTVKTGAVAQADTQVVGSAETGYQLINTKTGETIKNIMSGIGIGGNNQDLADDATYILTNTANRAEAISLINKSKPSLMAKYGQEGYDKIMAEIDRVYPKTPTPTTIGNSNWWDSLFGGGSTETQGTGGGGSW